MQIVAALYHLVFPDHQKQIDALNRHRLGVWIMRGLKLGATEDPGTYLHIDDQGAFRCCALGIGLVGKYGNPEAAHEAYYRECDRKLGGSPAMAHLLGIPLLLADRIVMNHIDLRVSAKKIALELIGGTMT